MGKHPDEQPDPAYFELVQVKKAFEPVLHWYAGDGDRSDLAGMIGDAVADLQQDREALLTQRQDLLALQRAVKEIVTEQLDRVCWLDGFRKLAHLVGCQFDPLLLPREQMLSQCARFVDALQAGREEDYTPDELTQRCHHAVRLLAELRTAMEKGESLLSCGIGEETYRVEITVTSYTEANRILTVLQEVIRSAGNHAGLARLPSGSRSGCLE